MPGKLVTILTNHRRTLATGPFTGYNVYWYISADHMDTARVTEVTRR